MLDLVPKVWGEGVGRRLYAFITPFITPFYAPLLCFKLVIGDQRKISIDSYNLSPMAKLETSYMMIYLPLDTSRVMGCHLQTGGDQPPIKLKQVGIGADI